MKSQLLPEAITAFTAISDWFSVQKVFEKFLWEISELSPYLSLKLPASSKYVNEQIRRLNFIQQQLEIIENRVFIVFGTGTNLSARQAYQILTELIEEMTYLSITLKLLAQESLIDPEGTVVVLSSTQMEVADLLNRLNQLKAAQNKICN